MFSISKRRLSTRAAGTWLSTALAIGAVLVPASVAGATVTSSHIDGLSDPLVLATVDEANGGGSTPVAVHGLAPAAVAADHVDIRCKTGGYFSVLASGVAIVPTKNVGPLFSVSIPSSDFPTGGCRLAAVPAGTTPTDLSKFTGPRVYSSSTMLYTNLNNDPYIFEVGAGSIDHSGAVSVDSMGNLGLKRLVPLDPLDPSSTRSAFDAGAAVDDGFDGRGRSGLRIDGHNAYGPTRLEFRGLGGLANFDPLGYSGGIDSNGLIHISEVDPIRTCPNDPPGKPSPDPNAGQFYCGASLLDAGVADHRELVSSHEDRVLTVIDHWVSTDGQAHHLNVQFSYMSNEFGAPGWRALWNASSFSAPTGGDQVAMLGGGRASTVEVEEQNGLQDDQIHPVGAVTWPDAPDNITYPSPDTMRAGFDRVIPATGDLVITHAFATGFSIVDATALADAQAPPELAVTAPADQATVQVDTVSVTGTATDNVAVSGVTVNAKSVALSSDGSFSVPISVGVGTNPVTVVASDQSGNQTTRTLTVTYELPAGPAGGTVGAGGTVAPKVLHLPHVGGRHLVGDWVRCVGARFDGSDRPTSLIWSRGAKQIPDATSDRYRIGHKDAGRRLTCAAIGANATGRTRAAATNALVVKRWCVVPRVKGISFKRARARLIAAGCKPRQAGHGKRVSGTNPPASTRKANGTRITLHLTPR